MADERDIDRGGDGSEGDDAGFGGEDKTVIVDEVVFVRRFFDRFPAGLRGLADRFDEHREVVFETDLDEAALEELRERMRAAELILAGAGRGIERILAARRGRLSG